MSHLDAIEFTEEWDAGDLGCGDLLIILSIKMRRLPVRSCLKLTATDPGAVEDIPAWCTLTRHRLLAASHPVYAIQRRDD